MALGVPALSTRAARSRGRGAAPQGEAGGRTAGDQGTSVAAMQGPMARGEEHEDHEGQDDDNDKSRSGDESSSSSGDPSDDDKEPKPPARSKGATKKKTSEDMDEGKEGTADDIPIPRKMEARRREREPGWRPTTGAGAGSRTDRSASESARLAGDFGTPRNRERQAHFATAYRLSVSRMFLSLGLSDEIVDAIVDEQGYNTPHALNRVDKKGVKQLISAICKPGGMKDGTRNLGINVPL